MPLYDSILPSQTNKYTSAFNAMSYNKAVSDNNRYNEAARKGYKYGKPVGDAAIGVLSAIAGPFGLLIGAAYGAGSLGVDALVRGRKKQLAARIEKERAMSELPAFGYGFDENGQFVTGNNPIPGREIDNGIYGTDSGLGMALGKSIGGAIAPTMSPVNYTSPTFDVNNYSQPALPTAPTNYGTPVETQRSEGNMDWNGAFNNSGSQFNPPANMKKGGKVVVGGDGDDDIALVEEDSGKDTGVRVSKGEMLVVNKDRLNALKKALKAKNQKEVFNIIKAQVNEPVKGKNFKGGGIGEEVIFEEEKSPFVNGYIPYSDFGTGEQATDDNYYQKPAFVKMEETFAPGYEEATTAQRPKYNWQDAVENGIGYGWDAFRMVEGMQAAGQKLPVFQKPADWNELVGRMRLNSYRGLTSDQRALYNLDRDRQYSTDVNNIMNLSGGNAGLALSSLGRANMDKYTANLRVAALDSDLMNRNMNQYQGILNQDIGYNRQIFNDERGIAMLNKQAGAKLSQDAIMNMQQRNLTNRFYGAGSQQDKLQNAYLKRIQDENDITSMNLERWRKNPNAFNPYTGNTGDWDITDKDEIEVDGEKYVKKPKTKKKE